MIKKIINNEFFGIIAIFIFMSIFAILLSSSMIIISGYLTNKIIKQTEEIKKLNKSLDTYELENLQLHAINDEMWDSCYESKIQ